MASLICPDTGDSPSNSPIELSQFSAVASYNWLDSAQAPTILVPGIPPIWSPPTDTPALKPDSGTRYIDQNTDRMPQSPLEPLIRAVQTYRPDFKLYEMDLVTDRRCLRQLYGFISGDEKTFRFGVESVGNVTVFTRAEPQSRETLSRNTFAGYRQSFEEAYTRLHGSARGSTSHHRIVNYTIGGMNFLVRSGTDAYLRSAGEAAAEEFVNQRADANNGDENFSKNIKTLSLNKPITSTSALSATDDLQIVRGLSGIFQDAVLELSTHTASKPSVIDAKMVDLYFSQTPLFVEATFRSTGPRHYLPAQRARFENVTITDVRSQTKEWEAEHQSELNALVNVLRQIIAKARGIGRPCSVRYEGGKHLKVEEVKHGEMPSLPEGLKNVFLEGGKDTTPGAKIQDGTTQD